MKDKITIFLVTEQDQVIFQGIVVTGLFHDPGVGVTGFEPVTPTLSR